jgi:hypothetical protein
VPWHVLTQPKIWRQRIEDKQSFQLARACELAYNKSCQAVALEIFTKIDEEAIIDFDYDYFLYFVNCSFSTVVISLKVEHDVNSLLRVVAEVRKFHLWKKDMIDIDT